MIHLKLSAIKEDQEKSLNRQKNQTVNAIFSALTFLLAPKGMSPLWNVLHPCPFFSVVNVSNRMAAWKETNA